MKFRDLVTFDADFPDDSEWDEKGNQLVPEGKGIAELLRSELEKRGSRSTKVTQHSFYGWAFEVTSGNGHFWCMLQLGKNVLLLLKDKTSCLFLGGHKARFERIQDCIQEILLGDKRFSRILWYTQSDYEAQEHHRAKSTPR